MKNNNSFYIGWQEKMPKSQSLFLKRILIPVFLLIPLLSFLIVWSQKPFNNHIFQLGNITEHTGIYHSEPVPILEVTSGSIPDQHSNHMLLVGYGKFGAEGIISEIEQSKGSLNNKKITLKGSLIYGDGKAVLELTKKEKSLVQVFDQELSKEALPSTVNNFENKGEILDPKCYFGVMKPGEGKIHKSCAIRCISGGIPPIFRINNVNGPSDYYVLLGPQKEKINTQILDKIGEEVNVKGKVTTVNGWNVVYANPDDIR